MPLLVAVVSSDLPSLWACPTSKLHFHTKRARAEADLAGLYFGQVAQVLGSSLTGDEIK